MSQDLVESFSGIRGIYGKGITEKSSRKYVLSFLKLLKPEAVVIGGDSRPSTASLKSAVIEAIKDGGIKKIIDLGVLPVQAAEYAIVKFRADGGVYISASHNEPEYNGFKFLKEDGAILKPEQFDEFIKTAHSYNPQGDVISYNPQRVNGCGAVKKQEEAVDNYISFILEKIGSEALNKIKASRFKVLADPNGGSAIKILSKLFQRMGIEVEIINNKLGIFNRTIEPKTESLDYLVERMSGGQFDFACGFDCDADRVEFVVNPNSHFAREAGPVLNGNYVLALSCEAVLKGTENQVVINTDASSYLVRDVIGKYKATVKEVEVGEINVVEEMERNNSIISGEGSCAGVIVWPIKCRDGIMAAALIIKMLAREGKSLLDILDSYPRYYQIREKVKCPAEKILEFKKEFEEYFKDKGFKIQKTGNETGGLKAIADNNNFVWCRQSKTEPGAFRIWSDGNNKQKVESLIQEALEVFRGFQAKNL